MILCVCGSIHSSAMQKYLLADVPEKSSPNGFVRKKCQPERVQPDSVCQGPKYAGCASLISQTQPVFERT